MSDRFIKYYEIGGVPFSVETPYEYEEKEPYSLFSSPRCEPGVRYVFGTCDTLPEPDGRFVFEDQNYRTYTKDGYIYRYAGFFAKGRVLAPSYALIKYGVESSDLIEVTMPEDQNIPKNSAFVYKCLCIEHLITSQGAIILHSSYIKTEKGSILFTAPSGTGKSTQAELWRKYRGARVINGDCSIVRVTGGVAQTYGIPFSGTSGICFNESAPLRAVVYLTQAPENRIERLGGMRAFGALMEGIKANTWNSRDTETAADTLTAICTAVPVFKLDCVPDESAVAALEAELEKNKI